MKDGFWTKVFIAAALFFAALAADAGNPLPELNGAWTNTGLLVRGQREDLPDPKLRVVSVFLETGINHVFAWRDDRPGFCGWRALWSYDPDTKSLSQQIIAMDSRSAAECAKDPVFRPGRTVVQPLTFVNGELRLLTTREGEPVQTLWTRLENADQAPPLRILPAW